ncbi:MAG: hypothetical protein AAB091_07880 [Elusimicrobiota bacterium]
MPKTNSSQLLEQLVHDVNSKCGSLKSAAGLLLRTAEPAQVQELLGLMVEQAESLAQSIADFKQHLE